MLTQVVGGGPLGPNPLGVDPTFLAARITAKPLEFAGLGKVLGHYRVGGSTGALTVVAAAGPVFSWRWTDGSSFCVPMQIKISAAITTVFTTQQALDLDMIKVSGFTASDTGGTPLTPGANQQKMRSTMGSSLLTDARIATTAALGAGTRTLETSPMWAGPMATGNALGYSQLEQVIYEPDLAAGQHPLVLGQNEGFLLRIATTMGAAGIMKLNVSVKWAEVVVF